MKVRISTVLQDKVNLLNQMQEVIVARPKRVDESLMLDVQHKNLPARSAIGNH